MDLKPGATADVTATVGPDRTAHAKAAAVAAPGHEPLRSLPSSDSPAVSVRPELITFTPLRAFPCCPPADPANIGRD